MSVTIPASFAYAVAVAAEIITDDAATTLTETDLTRATIELSKCTGRWAAELGEVVALGTEYMATVNDPDEAEMRAALYGFDHPDHGGRFAADCWRQYIGATA